MIKYDRSPYPFLKAKAAQAKHTSRFCLMLAQRQAGYFDRAAFQFRAGRLHGRSAEYRTLIVRLFEGVVEYYDALDVTPFVALNCRAAMYKFLRTLDSLHTLWCTGLGAEERRQQPFHVRQKTHMLTHLVDDQLECWGSPKMFTCYMDEDYVGACKQVCAACKHPATLERTAMEKTRVYAGCQTCRANL